MQPITLQRKLMGSPFTFQAYPAAGFEEDEIKACMNLAFAEVSRIEDLLTDFRASPFNKINEMAGLSPVEVDEEVFELISQCMRIAKDSDGAFDISYATVGHLWREAKKKGMPPSERDVANLMEWVDYKRIEIDAAKRSVYLPHPKMRVGLGGIGKGYAVDRAYEMLLKMGMENFFINGAGDIRVHTNKTAKRPWRVAIRNPMAEKNVPMGMIQMRQGSIATSGDYERFFRYEGKSFHHVLNTQTGMPTDEVVSATVLAPYAILCDVYATTAMSLGAEQGIAFLNRRARTTGFLVTKAGKILYCEDWHDQKNI